jgi:hypothetical protein
MSRRSQPHSRSTRFTTIPVPLLAAVLAFAISPGPVVDAADETVFTSLRAMQSTYSQDGGNVILEWKVEGLRFSMVVIWLDSKLSMWQTQDNGGIEIEGVPPGFHEFTVAGITPTGSLLKTTDMMVLTECPLEALPPFNCLFFGYEPQSGRGFLQVTWSPPTRPREDPWVDFEIILNNQADGEFRWLSEEPDHAVTFSNIRESLINIAIIGSTQSYLAPPATRNFSAVGLLPPRDPRMADLACQDGQGTGTLHYTVPPDTVYDRVAVWVTSNDGTRDYRGLFESIPTAVEITGLPELSVDVEIAGVKMDTDGELAVSYSNFPGRPGSHAIARAWINCAGRTEYRRGDADADGRADITDAIRILSFLFLDFTPLPCPDSGDVDGNGALEITDPVRLLTFLFGDGEPIPEPGPLACGVDPSGMTLGACTYDACTATELR